MLDLLRERPRTTGELTRSFAVSRFAVMKHLNVLTDADLVLVRRHGRERWNHLNAVPLRRVWERWLQPYESAWAVSLFRFQRDVEGSSKGEEAMPEMTAPMGTLGTFVVEQEVRIDAPRAKVFDAMTGDISAWWGAPYLQFAEGATAVTLDPKPGGFLRESWSDGDGAVWGTVTSFLRNERIIVTGAMGMSGAVHGTIRFDLKEPGGSTLVRLSHRAIGEVSEELQAGYGQGWQDLLGRRLKTFVETGRRMGIGHEPSTE